MKRKTPMLDELELSGADLLLTGRAINALEDLVAALERRQRGEGATAVLIQGLIIQLRDLLNAEALASEFDRVTTRMAFERVDQLRSMLTMLGQDQARA